MGITNYQIYQVQLSELPPIKSLTLTLTLTLTPSRRLVIQISANPEVIPGECESTMALPPVVPHSSYSPTLAATKTTAA